MAPWLERLTRLAAIALVGLIAVACGDTGLTDDGVERTKVVIAGETFRLEIADDDDSRILGLSHRDSIAERGGMIFVFPRDQRLQFLMRHCLVEIDIAFLDASGRVVALHEMVVEPPQREGESDLAYESRLQRYDSRFKARFAVEVAGGTLRALGVETGDRIDFDVEGLKARAR